MKRTWLLVISALGLISSSSVLARTVQLQLKPPLNQTVRCTIALKTKISDAQNSANVVTSRSSFTNDLTFTDDAGQLWGEVHVVSVEKAVNEMALPQDPPFSLRGVTERIQLSPNGQGQRAVRLESVRAALKAQALSGSDASGDTHLPFSEQGTLRVWNSIVGTIWMMVVGQNLELDSLKTFSGQLQLGLPNTDLPDVGIDATPLTGTITLHAVDAQGPTPQYRLTYTYSGELEFNDHLREGLSGVMKTLLPTLGNGRWVKSRVTGEGEGLIDGKTLLILQSTLRQHMNIEGESGTAFHIEREVTSSMSVPARAP